MTSIVLLFAQLASPAPADQPPDIEIRARVQAKQVKVRQEGRARLDLRVEPGEAEPVVVHRSAPAGRSTYRNLVIDLDAAVHLTNPARRAEPTPGAVADNQTGETE